MGGRKITLLLTNKQIKQMKKLILFIVLLGSFLTINLQAQVSKTTTLQPDIYINEYSGVAIDTLGTVTATTWAHEFVVNKTDGLFFNARVKLSDKTTGANGVASIKLQEKYFATDAYADITTILWTGVGSTDTIAPFTQVTTKQYQRYFRILVTCTGGKAKVDYTKISFKKN